MATTITLRITTRIYPDPYKPRKEAPDFAGIKMAAIANPHTLREWVVTTFEPLKNDTKLRSEMTTEKAARAFVQWVANQVEENRKKLLDFAETERNEQEEEFLTALALDIEVLLDRIHEEEMKVELKGDDPAEFIERFLEHLRRHAERTEGMNWFQDQSMEWEAEASFVSQLVGGGTDAWVAKAVDILRKGDNMTSERIRNRWPDFSAWLNEKLREIRDELSREGLFKNQVLAQFEMMTRDLDSAINCARNVTGESVAEKKPYEVWLGLTGQSANMAAIEDRMLTDEDLYSIPWKAIIAATEKWMDDYWVLIGAVRDMFTRPGVREGFSSFLVWNSTEVNFIETLEDSKYKVACLDDAYNTLLERGMVNGDLSMEVKDKVNNWFQITYKKIEESLETARGD